MGRWVLAAGLSWAMVLAGAGTTMAGAQAGTPGPPRPRGPFGESTPPDQTAVRMQEQQAKARNQDRQKKLEDDTAKLYALASELKDEVAKTNKDTMSVDVIKKADEIERLAHNVKERMKG